MDTAQPIMLSVRLIDINNLEHIPARTFTLESSWEFKIGRGSQSDSVIQPRANNAWFGSKVMSREHATIRVDPITRRVHLEDNRSLHGTFMGAKKLQPQAPSEIYHNDVVTFGTDIVRADETYPALALEFQFRWSDDPKIPGVPDPFRNTFTADYSEDDTRSNPDDDEVQEVLQDPNLFPLGLLSLRKPMTFSVPDSDESDNESLIDSDDQSDSLSLTETSPASKTEVVPSQYITAESSADTVSTMLGRTTEITMDDGETAASAKPQTSDHTKDDEDPEGYESDYGEDSRYEDRSGGDKADLPDESESDSDGDGSDHEDTSQTAYSQSGPNKTHPAEITLISTEAGTKAQCWNGTLVNGYASSTPNQYQYVPIHPTIPPYQSGSLNNWRQPFGNLRSYDCSANYNNTIPLSQPTVSAFTYDSSSTAYNPQVIQLDRWPMGHFNAGMLPHTETVSDRAVPKSGDLNNANPTKLSINDIVEPPSTSQVESVTGQKRKADVMAEDDTAEIDTDADGRSPSSPMAALELLASESVKDSPAPSNQPENLESKVFEQVPCNDSTGDSQTETEIPDVSEVRPLKKVKMTNEQSEIRPSRGKALMKYGAVCLTGAIVGSVSTIFGLAALPADFFN